MFGSTCIRRGDLIRERMAGLYGCCLVLYHVFVCMSNRRAEARLCGGHGTRRHRAEARKDLCEASFAASEMRFGAFFSPYFP
jgi:hypothetical protein